MHRSAALILIIVLHAIQALDDPLDDAMSRRMASFHETSAHTTPTPSTTTDEATDIASDEPTSPKLQTTPTTQSTAAATTDTTISSNTPYARQTHTTIVTIMPTISLGVPSATGRSNFSIKIQNETLEISVPAGAWTRRRTAAQLTVTAFAIPNISTLHDAETNTHHRPLCNSLVIALGPDGLVLANDIALRMPCPAYAEAMQLQAQASSASEWNAHTLGVRDRWITTRTLGAFVASTCIQNNGTSFLTLLAIVAPIVICIAAACYIVERWRRRTILRQSMYKTELTIPKRWMASRVQPLPPY